MGLIIKTQASGIYESESDALKKIEKAFTEENEMRKTSPWYGYAGYRLVDSSGKEGEIDLVLLTNCNVIVVELKDWNGNSIRSIDGKWYMDDKDMGTSPVTLTRQKQFLVLNKLKSLQKKFTANPGHTPIVHFFVVMCGKVNFSNLPEDEAVHVITLDKFLKFSKKDVFMKHFRPHPKAQYLDKDFPLIQKIFESDARRPKKVTVQNYKQEEELLAHPAEIYTEFEATSTVSRSDKAIIRQWNFSKFKDLSIQSNKLRAELLTYERSIGAEFNQSRQLYEAVLLPKIIPQEEQITRQYNELVDYRQHYHRFNDFINSIGPNLDEDDRTDLIQILIGKFSEMHNLGISHGDINSHCIWISAQKDVAISHLMTAKAENVVNNIEPLQPSLKFLPLELQKKLESVSEFKKDTFMLGVLIWHLWTNIRLTSKSLNSLSIEGDHWVAQLVLKAIHLEISDPSDLLRQFNSARPVKDVEFIADIAVLDPYLSSDNLYKIYPEDQMIYEDDSNNVSLYSSENVLVKQWSEIHLTTLSYSEILKYQHFFEHLKEAKSENLPYLANFVNYGISKKLGSIFLVTEIVDGHLINDIELDKESRLELAANLLKAIIHLHKIGLPIGRIDHSSVLVDPENCNFVFNDIIDIVPTADYYSDYYPKHIDNPTSQQCENYAIVHLVCDVLDFAMGGDSSEFKWISDAVKNELDESDLAFLDLNRFLECVETAQINNETMATIRVPVKSTFNELDILPDNKRIYVCLEKSRKGSDVVVRLHGVGGAVQFFVEPQTKKVNYVSSVREADIVPPYVIENAVLELNVIIKIEHSVGTPQYAELTDFILSHTEFVTAIDEFVKETSENCTELNEGKESIEPIQSEYLNVQVDQTIGEDSLHDSYQGPSLTIKTRELWKAILETETEALPYVVVAKKLEHVDGRTYILRYEQEDDVLDKFRKDDLISLIYKTTDQYGEDKEFRVGDIEIQFSLPGELRIKGVKHPSKVDVGQVLYLRTKADKSSFLKRKNALEQILRRRSDIPNLIDYFEPKSEIVPTEYNVEVTDRDFERYNQYNDEGKLVVSLNSLQREAFRNLINFGPISILQGPPGTGKTEFIAALVHYLFERQNVQNVLMVSQSHEAVNTAAERIRKHCQRLNTPIDIVRFSNRESSVSMNLKDVYSDAIITTHRQLFLTEMEDRVLSLSQAIGVDKEYLACALFLKVNVFDHLEHVLLDVNSEEKASISKKEWNNLSFKIIERLKNYSPEMFEYLQGKTSTQMLAHQDQIWKELNKCYEVQGKSVLNAKALIQIACDYDQLIDSPNANYETYLSRTRQFVCGTCVGIGNHSIDIANQTFDWVIIDEAARSISSELAIAMQSAKRILLVGDHKQLPPLYSTEHAKALGRRLGLSKESIEQNLASDFERLFASSYGQAVNGKLLTQYRMAPAIGEMVSHCFYDDELHSGVIEPLDQPYNGELVRIVPNIYQKSRIQELHSTVTWVDTSQEYSDGKGTTFYNKHEARKIINLLKRISSDEALVRELRKMSKPNEPPIGVICMYGEQKRHLRNQFNSQPWSEEFRSLVKIDTVDSYQGKENRIIILSITRNSSDNKIGFMKVPNRINVALSRAMDRLVIFGATRLWTLPQHKQSPLGKVLTYISNREAEKQLYQIITEIQHHQKSNNIKGSGKVKAGLSQGALV